MPAVGGDEAPFVMDSENVAPEGKAKPLVKVVGAGDGKPYRIARTTALTVQNMYAKGLSRGHKELINNGLKGALKMSPEAIRDALSFMTTQENIESTCDMVDTQFANIVQTVAERKNVGFGIIEDVSARSTAVIQGLWSQVSGLVGQGAAKVKDTVKAVDDVRCNLVDGTTKFTGDTIVWGASIVGAGEMAEKHLVPIVKYGGEVVKTPTKAYRETVEILDADQDGEVSVSDVVATATAAASSVVEVIQKFSVTEFALGTLESNAAKFGELIGEEEEPQEGAGEDDSPTEEQTEGCKSWVGQSLEGCAKAVPQTVKVLNKLRVKARRFSSKNPVMRLDIFDVVENAITTALTKADQLAAEDLSVAWGDALLAAQEKVGELRDAVNTLLTLPIASETKDRLIQATSAWFTSVGEDAWAPINDCSEYIASYKDRLNLEGAKSFVKDTTDLTAHAVGYARNDEKYGKLDQQLKKLLQSIFNIRLIFVNSEEDDG